MKKKYALGMLLCMAAICHAQNSIHPMLKDGRVWNYMSFYEGDEDDDGDVKIDTVYHSVSMEGPIEFDEHQCYKVKNTNYYMYEENSKVFAYMSDDPFLGEYNWQNVYDFSLEAGENGVMKIDTILVNGEQCRRLKFVHDIWVEGIGSSNFDMLSFWVERPGAYHGTRLLSVYDKEQIVFTYSDFSREAYSPTTAQVKKTVYSEYPVSKIWYAITGIVDSKPRKGVYIRDGRKVVVK